MAEASGAKILQSGVLRWFLAIAVAAGLYFLSTQNYLLFHSLAEIFGIVIAFALFSMAWNVRRHIRDVSLVNAGIAYLFIGFLDLLHTLAYQGLGVFPDYDFYAPQVWIAARMIESVTLLVLVLTVNRIKNGRHGLVWTIYSVLTGLAVAMIFIWKVFPVCFVPGVGLTRFKILAEYMISMLLVLSLVIVYVRRTDWETGIIRCLVASIVLSVLSELSFTLYVDMFGLSNLIGHLLKILSYYFIYRAILIDGILDPLSDFLKELNDKNAMQRRMLSIIGHDLRNSVSGIANVASIMTENRAPEWAPRDRQLLETIRESAEKTGETLQSLLDWATAQAGALEAVPEVFLVSTAIDAVLGDYRAFAEQKRIKMSASGESGIAVYADSRMFKTVLRNLVANALKFTPREGTVDVEWTLRGERVDVSVTDSGTGLSSDDVRRITSPAGVIHSRAGTNGERGTGLGLEIVRSFLALNDASLRVDSTPGRGTVIVTEWSEAELDRGET